MGHAGEKWVALSTGHVQDKGENRLRLIVETMPVMVDAFDHDERIVVWNRECERVTGYSAREIVGNPRAMELLYPDAEYREHVMASVRKEDGDFRNLELVLTSKNGEPRTVLWSNLSNACPIAGWATWAVGIDITQRRQAEREREELIARLEAQNSELERFTYTVSHDMKTPLITINGYLAILQEDLSSGNTDSVSDDLRRISSAADTMALLLDDLLELSRIGRLMNPSQDAPLGDLVQEAALMLERPLRKRHVELVVEPDLPVVRGDRARLLEVFQNLIDNAVKYMGVQDRPRIEIGTRRDKGDLVCYVRDNGIGIEPRFHKRVFGLFDQLDPRAEGTGIGLALVKRIVEVHGGRIWIESEGLGHGSTFCFTIPPLPDVGDGSQVALRAKRRWL